MNQHVELETKLEVDERGFQILKESTIIKKCVDQLNVYYDDAWKLAQCSATLRVRYQRGRQPQLTLKVPVEYRGEKRVMREFETEFAGACTRDECRVKSHLRLSIVEDLPPEMGHQVSQLGVRKLRRVGWMRNQRYVLLIEGVGELELDRVGLPNGATVYEAEIESSDPVVHQQLVAFVRERVPSAQHSEISKFERFRRALATSESMIQSQ